MKFIKTYTPFFEETRKYFKFEERVNIRINRALGNDEVTLLFYLINKDDSTADMFADNLSEWCRKNDFIYEEDTKYNQDYDISAPIFDDTKNKDYSLVKLSVKKQFLPYVKKYLLLNLTGLIKE